jgi:hypothetical protein
LNLKFLAFPSPISTMYLAHILPILALIPINALQLNVLVRKALGVACVATTLIQFPDLSHAGVGDLMEGATSAMMYSKERSSAERDFATLPAAAQKRAALAACKDSNLRSMAQMGSSASECSRSVIDGQYGSMKKVLSGEYQAPQSAPRSSVSSSSQVSASSTKASIRASSSSSTKSADPASTKENLVKVTDLSDLPLASKKRRAIAACKKPSTRKFAGMGSESKCTENVMGGNYERLIEALEYGK